MWKISGRRLYAAACDAAGRHVLEVKYDEFLPDPVRQLLALETLQRTSYSKYYICRQFDI